MKEFNLSEKIMHANPEPIGGLLCVEDVKEFIRLLKEKIVEDTEVNEENNRFCVFINELVGENLI